MKKIIALLLVAVMAIGFCACAAKTEAPAEPAAAEETTTTEAAETTETAEPAAEETTEETTTENQHFDKLTLEFVPSKDADVIITGTKNLPELVKAKSCDVFIKFLLLHQTEALSENCNEILHIGHNCRRGKASAI